MGTGLFSGLGSSIDSFLSVYVTAVSANIATAIAPLVTLGLTTWIMLYGYSVLRQEVSDPLNVFFKNVVKFSFIFGIALTGATYQSIIVETVNALQDALVGLVTPSSGIVSANGANIYQLLDDIHLKGDEMGLFVLLQGASKLPVGGWLDLCAGLIVLITNTIMLALCGGFVLLTKVAMAFVLGIGPLFIVCLAFPPMAKFFDNWLSQVMNYLFFIAILSFSIGLSMSITDSYLQHAIASRTESENLNQIAEAFSFAMLQITLLFLVYQAPHKAAALAGGSALSGGGLLQIATGWMMGHRSQKNRSTSGGSIEGAGDGNSGNGRQGIDRPQSRIPAYRRASRDRYGPRQ